VGRTQGVAVRCLNQVVQILGNEGLLCPLDHDLDCRRPSPVRKHFQAHRVGACNLCPWPWRWEPLKLQVGKDGQNHHATDMWTVNTSPQGSCSAQDF
jgi:hypothetical protein